MSIAHKLALGASGLCIASRLIAAEALPSNEDLRHIRRLDDPRMSPSGTRVLIHIADATADGGRSHVWLVDVASTRLGSSPIRRPRTRKVSIRLAGWVMRPSCFSPSAVSARNCFSCR